MLISQVCRKRERRPDVSISTELCLCISAKTINLNNPNIVVKIKSYFFLKKSMKTDQMKKQLGVTNFTYIIYIYCICICMYYTYWLFVVLFCFSFFLLSCRWLMIHSKHPGNSSRIR